MLISEVRCTELLPGSPLVGHSVFQWEMNEVRSKISTSGEGTESLPVARLAWLAEEKEAWTLKPSFRFVLGSKPAATYAFSSGEKGWRYAHLSFSERKRSEFIGCGTLRWENSERRSIPNPSRIFTYVPRSSFKHHYA